MAVGGWFGGRVAGIMDYVAVDRGGVVRQMDSDNRVMNE